MIPKIVHLCFGMTPDFGGKPWSLVHHGCLRSIVERIKPAEVRFYYSHPPASERLAALPAPQAQPAG